MQFSYDAWGNLFPASVTQGSAQTVGATPDQTNRIAGYCYDAAGNLIFAGSCGATQTYQYDGENRISTTAGVTYTYDGDGRRVAKSNGKVYWYGLGSDPLAESDGLGTISDEYIFFGGKRIARRTPSGFLGYSTFYNFADHLGTARVILQDGTTTPCFDADYYPFGGERTPVVNTCPQNYKFTGKERDAESNLDYFGARYYASTTGRFASTDPMYFQEEMLVDPQRFNLYVYARNNPLLWIDPTGQRIELTGKTEEERKAQLEAIQETVGKAGNQLVAVQDKDGKFYVEIQGDAQKFANSNDVAKEFAGIIGSKEVAKFALASGDEELPIDDGWGNRTLNSMGDFGARGISSRDKSGNLWVIVNKDKGSYVRDHASYKYQGGGGFEKIVNFLLGVPTAREFTIGHEFGHAKAQMKLGSDSMGKSALDLENKVRDLKNPGGQHRVIH